MRHTLTGTSWPFLSAGHARIGADWYAIPTTLRAETLGQVVEADDDDCY